MKNFHLTGNAIKHPTTSLLSTLAFLYLLKESKETYIPTKPESFKQYMKDIIEDKFKWIENEGQEKKNEMEAFVKETKNSLLDRGFTLSKNKITEVTEYLFDKGNKIKEFSEDICGNTLRLLEKGIDEVALSPEEYIYCTNLDFLDKFFRDLKEEENNEDYEIFLKSLVEFKEDYKENGTYNEELLEDLIEKAKLNNILIKKIDGYIEWSFCDDLGISNGDAHQFMVDIKTGDLKDQREKAEYLSYNQTFQEGFAKFLQNQYFEVGEHIYGFKEWAKLVKDGEILISFERGLTYYITAAGERYLIAPGRFCGEILSQVYNKDFNATTLVVSYTDTLIPIMIYSTTVGLKNSIAELILKKGGFKNWPSASKVFGKSFVQGLTAPISPLKHIYRYGSRGLLSMANWDSTTLMDLVQYDKERFLESLRETGRQFLQAKNLILSKLPGKYGRNYQLKTDKLKEIHKKRINILELKRINTLGNLSTMKTEFEKHLGTYGAYDPELDELKKKILEPNGLDINPEKLRSELDTYIKQKEKQLQKIKEEYSKISTHSSKTNLEISKKLLEEYNKEADIKNKEKLQNKIKDSLSKAGPEGKKILDSDPFADPEKAISQIDQELSKIQSPDTTSTSPSTPDSAKTASNTPEDTQNKPGDSPKSTPDETRISNEEFEKLTEPEKIQKIQDVDAELIEKMDEFAQKKEALEKEFKKVGKDPLKSKSYKKLLRNYKVRIKNIQKRRKRLTLRILKSNPDLDLKKNKIQIDPSFHGDAPKGIDSKHIENGSMKTKMETGKIKIPERIKSNKMLIGTILVTAASFLVGSAANAEEDEIDYNFYEDEDNTDYETLDEEDLENDPETKEMLAEARTEAEESIGKEEPDNEYISEEDERMFKDEQLKEIGKEREKVSRKFANFFETLYSQEYLPKLSASGVIDAISLENVERKLQLSVNRFADEYENESAKFMMMMIEKEELINGFFKDNPDLQEKGWPILNSMFKIAWDKESQKAYLSYGTRDEFIEMSYGIADAFTKNEFSKMGGKDAANATVEIGGNFIPFFGSGRDLFRAYKNLGQRGNTKQGLIDLGFGVGGLALDVATVGTGSALGVKALAKEGVQAGLKTLRIGMDLSPIFMMGHDLSKNAYDYLTDTKDSIIFGEKYYADKPKDSKPIPFKHPPITGLTKAKSISEDPREAKIELQELFVSIKNSYYWRACVWEIKDENTVLVKRLQSDNETTITREKDGNWNLEGVLSASGGYSIQQAFVMANLSNSTMEWLNEKEESGASENPFYVSSGGDIEFDADWTPVAINYLSSDNEWLEAYERSFDIPKDWIVNLLNRTYKKYLQKNSISGRFLELQNKITNKSK